MAGTAKPDYPGLLVAGFHTLSLSDARKLCVDPFPLSKTREALWGNLCEVIDRFTKAGLRCEFWIDGSFVTQKIDPEDVDVVALLPASVYNIPMDIIAGKVLGWFDDDELWNTHRIDAYHLPYHPEGSPLRSATDDAIAYWTGMFGTGRDNVTEKGFVVINVNGGVR